MRISLFLRRTLLPTAAVLGWLLSCGAATGRGGVPLPPVLALAFGVGSTPTPTPAPTPTPTPAPTPLPDGPRRYEFPAEHPLVTITMPTKWNASFEKGTGKLLGVPTDAQTGYSATLGRGGDFTSAEQARAYLDAQVKEAVANAKLTAVKMRPVQNGKLGSGLECQIQVIDGKIGAVPTGFVFICLAPIEGKYFLLVARGRSDKLLNDAGIKVVGDMADSIKAL